MSHQDIDNWVCTDYADAYMVTIIRLASIRKNASSLPYCSLNETECVIVLMILNVYQSINASIIS
jgi:hypothetical protein